MDESIQSGLFQTDESAPLSPNNQKVSKDTELSALDEMFHASAHYRQGHEYMEMVNFISRFRHYSPFNCLLVYIQDPTVSYFASVSDWGRKFGRYAKRNARPLVALKPFSPVMFLYSLEETEGDPVPDEIINPFRTDGFLPGFVLSNTIHNCTVYGIEVRHDLKGLSSAGRAIRLDDYGRRKYADLNLSPASNYLILLNKTHEAEEQYSTLVHELAHIFCGHVGNDPSAWWESHRGQSEATVEAEAESVSYLTCRRRGLKTTSERYLSSYRSDPDAELPNLSMSAVLQATDYIEKMGNSIWKKPSRKPKREVART